jgi:putative hydrolase of the HAD superfamily
MSRPPIRAAIFDAGHTLLEMDYAQLTGFLRSRGHEVEDEAVIDAERRARMCLDVERAAEPTRGRTGEGRYVRYLMERLDIADDAERRAVAEWRRGFNAPIGLCHRADGEAAAALGAARAAGLIVGVISNSNGSVALALERAGIAAHLDFVIDSTVFGAGKPDPRIFAAGLQAAGTDADEAVYIGDSYFVDVVGARRAGLGAVLFDPGGLGADRQCLAATGLRKAVALALDRSEATRERLAFDLADIEPG